MCVRDTVSEMLGSHGYKVYAYDDPSAVMKSVDFDPDRPENADERRSVHPHAGEKGDRHPCPS